MWIACALSVGIEEAKPRGIVAIASRSVTTFRRAAAKGPHFLPTRASGGRETFGTLNVAALWLKIPANDNNLPVLNLTSNLVPSLQS